MKLAIFDFDGTLFPQDTLPYLAKQWKIQKRSRLRLAAVLLSIGVVFAQHKLGIRWKKREGAVVAVMQRFTHLFSGMREAAVNEFFDRCAESIKGELDAVIVEEVWRLKSEGFHIVLLSGCYEYLLGAMANFLSADTVIGTKLNYKNGRVNLLRPLEVTYGPEKIKRLYSLFDCANVDWEASTAYADSGSDLPVLELVGSPVAVGPAPELEEAAIERGWRIIPARPK